VAHQTLLERNSVAIVERHCKPLLNVLNAVQKFKLELSSAPTVEQNSSNHSFHYFYDSPTIPCCLVNWHFKEDSGCAVSVTFLFPF
jgi:hypothetical protein